MRTAFSSAHSTLKERLETIHRSVRNTADGIDRIAVVNYDARSDTLSTFLHSSNGLNPLERYVVPLSQVPSLQILADARKIRVLNDIKPVQWEKNKKPARHLRAIYSIYRSSLTVPFYAGKELRGFVFFNSFQSGYFTERRVDELFMVAESVAALAADARKPVEMLERIVHVTQDICHFRDDETGAHLDRVANYARIIATAMAGGRTLDDEFIQTLFLFAPLHDIGKVRIPDSVLHKPGPLTKKELAIMRNHPRWGVEICHRLMDDTAIITPGQRKLLCDIIYHHHEAWDGSGYPDGLAGEKIPLAAAIVAVADVFDAVTSVRPYKMPWTPEEAFLYLESQAGRLLHPACVRAFLERRDDVMEVYHRFQDGVAPGRTSSSPAGAAVAEIAR